MGRIGKCGLCKKELQKGDVWHFERIQSGGVNDDPIIQKEHYDCDNPKVK